MSTKQEWIDLAEFWEKKAQAAYSNGDIVWGNACDRKARSCRVAADYAQEEEQVDDHPHAGTV